MYDIWMRCYPQADMNMTEEWELEPMTLLAANKLIDRLERDFSNDGWKGHRMYKAKFYAVERKS